MFNILTSMLLLFSCATFALGQRSKPNCAPPIKSDWVIDGLRGQVRTSTSFKAWNLTEQKLGKIRPSKLELDEKIRYDRAGNQVDWRNVNYLPRDTKDEITPIYTCDSNDRIIESKSTRADNSLCKRITYRYDGKGKEAEMAEYFPDGTLERKEEYSYDEKGNLIEEIDTQQVHPEHFSPKRYDVYVTTKVTFKYDDRNNKIEEKHFYPDGSLYATWTYKYDLQSRLLKETRFDKQGRLKDQDVYIYGKNGLLREKLEYMNFCFKSDGTMCEGSIHTDEGTFYYATRTLYEYDRQGNWIRQTEFTIKENNQITQYEPSTMLFRKIVYY